MIRLYKFVKNSDFNFFSFLFFCSREKRSNDESNSFLNDNFNDKTFIVSGSTLNDGVVYALTTKKLNEHIYK